MTLSTLKGLLAHHNGNPEIQQSLLNLYARLASGHRFESVEAALAA